MAYICCYLEKIFKVFSNLFLTLNFIFPWYHLSKIMSNFAVLNETF